ncbi:hypothetical protein M2189_006192 [Bradyrhizobium japonicum]|nr:hypothetical protein BJS_08946 [Bradyrhizobium japonicum SEMIA 5079]MCS3962989.1 hypothetical protein [Bradyrhizobium japonicum]
MLDIVAPDQHQAAPAIDRGGVDHGKPGHPAALGVGTEPAGGESANQPCGDADQRQNDDERHDEGDWAALHTCPRQMALFSCPWSDAPTIDVGCPKTAIS